MSARQGIVGLGDADAFWAADPPLKTPVIGPPRR
jgi:hypothetical protein